MCMDTCVLVLPGLLVPVYWYLCMGTWCVGFTLLQAVLQPTTSIFEKGLVTETAKWKDIVDNHHLWNQNGSDRGNMSEHSLILGYVTPVSQQSREKICTCTHTRAVSALQRHVGVSFRPNTCLPLIKFESPFETFTLTTLLVVRHS